MKRIISALLFAALMPAGAFAQQSPAAVEGAPIADVCPIAVVTILKTGNGDKSSTIGQDFKAFLSSPDGPGVASGTIWINASGAAYHVAFKHRRVVSNTFAGELDPIVFHLPQFASLESAFIDSLDTPAPGPCRITSAWSPVLTHFLKADLRTTFDSAAATVDAIQAQPIDDPVNACHSPRFSPRTISAAQVEAPVGGGVGLVNVLVALNADSSIRELSIQSSPSALLSTVALSAAKRSRFQTEVNNCRPVASTYVFQVEFQNR